MSTITITTDKRTFINALVTLCKSAGIFTFKVENTKTVAPVAEMRKIYGIVSSDKPADVLAAIERSKAGNYEGCISFTDFDEMCHHFGVEPDSL